jgi:hypothetical protein
MRKRTSDSRKSWRVPCENLQTKNVRLSGYVPTSKSPESLEIALALDPSESHQPAESTGSVALDNPVPTHQEKDHGASHRQQRRRLRHRLKAPPELVVVGEYRREV